MQKKLKINQTQKNITSVQSKARTASPFYELELPTCKTIPKTDKSNSEEKPQFEMKKVAILINSQYYSNNWESYLMFVGSYSLSLLGLNHHPKNRSFISPSWL